MLIFVSLCMSDTVTDKAQSWLVKLVLGLRNSLHVPFIGSCETMASDGKFIWVGQPGYI